jgi:hypothetical protein
MAVTAFACGASAGFTHPQGLRMGGVSAELVGEEAAQ